MTPEIVGKLTVTLDDNCTVTYPGLTLGAAQTLLNDLTRATIIKLAVYYPDPIPLHQTRTNQQ